MANLAKIHRPAVEVELDDNITRKMSYRLSAFANMEERYGSVDEAMESLNKGKIADIIYMLWLGLKWEDKKLTEEMVGDLIDIRDLTQISECMKEVLQMDAPLGEAEAETTNGTPAIQEVKEEVPNE